MNGALILILFPVLFGVGLLLFREYGRIISFIAAGVSIVFGWLAWVLPLDGRWPFIIWELEVQQSFSVLGRQLILGNQDRIFIALLFSAAAIWFFGEGFLQTGSLFAPLGLGMIGFFVGALAVQPFLFATLFIAIGVLIFIPVLIPPGQEAGRGALRFLTMQLIGVPFILLAGWMVTEGESVQFDPELGIRASVLMGLGFALIVGVFPFHSWIPMLMVEGSAYARAFLLFALSGVVLFLGGGIIETYPFLRTSENVSGMLFLVGTGMCVVGGIFAAFQTNFGRIFGFSVLVDIGKSITALGLGASFGTPVFIILFASRIFSYLIWSVGLTLMQRELPDLSFRSGKSWGRVFPYTMVAMLVSQFSAAGFPLLLGFYGAFSLMDHLGPEKPAIALGVLIGTIGAIVAAIRSLSILFAPRENAPEKSREGRVQMGIFWFAGAFFIIGGALPNWLSAIIEKLR